MPLTFLNLNAFLNVEVAQWISYSSKTHSNCPRLHRSSVPIDFRASRALRGPFLHLHCLRLSDSVEFVFAEVSDQRGTHGVTHDVDGRTEAVPRTQHTLR